MESIDKILNFVKFTHRFQQVKRQIYVNHEDRNENDAEHSYQLALLSWYIINLEQLNLDISKAIKYALVHDLVETYAGDTYFHTTNEALKDSKEDREKKALSQIKSEFEEFSDLPQMIEEYESKQTKEAKFVYALDKVIPVLNIYLDNGRSWKRDQVTFKMIKNKDNKVKISEDIMPLWQEFTKLLEEKQRFIL